MVRVKYFLLVKITAIMFFLFIVLPALMRTFKGEDSSRNSDIVYDIPHNENREAVVNKDFNPNIHDDSFNLPNKMKEDKPIHEVKSNREEKNINEQRQIEPDLPDKNKHDLSHTHPELEAVFNENGKLGNYEPTNLEARSGPGENGEGVFLNKEEKVAGMKTVREYGFNMVASGKISMDRRIKDTRHAECKYWSYPEVSKLPTASVILVFFNEGFTTLMRTVHSVINTSPKELLKEIILVDDFSTKEDLKGRLEEYIKQFNGLVKLVRTTKREGLIRARVIGAENMSGDVIVILDAHCECVTNWLPPLLTRIAVNRKTVAVPIVESINWDTLKHNPYHNPESMVGVWEWGFLYKEMQISKADLAAKPRVTSPLKKTVACPIVDGIDWNSMEHTNIYGDTQNLGIWEWGFLYKEAEVPDREHQRHKYKSEPYWSPTHAGGLLAIEKNWFFELGGYDPGIKIWGAEQYELSFKVWQCGGTLEWVPCSHVAHIYRGPRTENSHPAGVSPHQNTINHLRLAHTWMDEYKEYYYIREPQIRNLDFGDISAQLAIKEKLQCKPFKWFMENIAYDMVHKFPLPPKNKVWGRVENEYSKKCLDQIGASFGQPIGLRSCHYGGGSQLFRLNVEGELSSGEHCFVSDKSIIKNKFCLDYQGIWKPVGEWDYDETTKLLKSNVEKKCVAVDNDQLTLKKCNEDDAAQKWTFKEIYLSN